MSWSQAGETPACLLLMTVVETTIVHRDRFRRELRDWKRDV